MTNTLSQNSISFLHRLKISIKMSCKTWHYSQKMFYDLSYKSASLIQWTKNNRNKMDLQI